MGKYVGAMCDCVEEQRRGEQELTACRTLPILSPSTRSKGTAVMSIQEILAAFLFR